MSNTLLPLVSVITPTYNRADLLPETIDSVLSQDYPNFEYIILDDGSTDNTVDLLKQYDDPRLKWESHNNMGESRTVNKGLEMAQGEYIVVVNSDDPVLPRLLRTSVDYMQAHDDVWVTYPDWLMIDDNSQPMQDMFVQEYSYLEMVRYHYCPIGPGAMFRREVVDINIRRDPQWRYVSDFAFWLDIGLHGKFKHLPEKLACWRSHAGGATTAFANKAMAKEHVEVVKRYFKRAELPQEARMIKREAMSNAHYIAAGICLPDERHAARIHFIHALLNMPFAPLDDPRFPRELRKMFKVIFLSANWEDRGRELRRRFR